MKFTPDALEAVVSEKVPPPVLSYATHRVTAGPEWCRLVPPLVFEQMVEDCVPGKNQPDYEGGIHTNRVNQIVCVCIIYSCGRQICRCQGGRSDPHCQLAPWLVEQFIRDCHAFDLKVVEIHPNDSCKVTQSDMDDNNWFLSVWNDGMPEWTNDIKQLHQGLQFGEMADLFLTDKCSKLVAGGRGVAGVSAGTTSVSYVGRDDQSFLNLPAYTKYTEDLCGFFAGMSALAVFVGFIAPGDISNDHQRLFLHLLCLLNCVDNATFLQMMVGSCFLRCHCDRFNSVLRPGIVTASHVYLEHDQSAYLDGIHSKYHFKRDARIMHGKKALDDFAERKRIISPVVDWLVELCDKLPEHKRTPVSFRSFGFHFTDVVDGDMFVADSSIDGLHYSSAFICAFEIIHEKFGLTLTQAVDLDFASVWQIQPLFFVRYAEHLVSLDQLPDCDLTADFVDFCNENFGGSTGGPRNRFTTFAVTEITGAEAKSSKKVIRDAIIEYSGMVFPEGKSDVVFNRLLKKLRSVKYCGDFVVQRFAHFLVGTGQISHPALLAEAEVASTTNTWQKIHERFPTVDHSYFPKILDAASAALTERAGIEIARCMIEFLTCEGIRFEEKKDRWDHRFPNQPLCGLRRDQKHQLRLLRLSPNGTTSVVGPIQHRKEVASNRSATVPQCSLDICCKQRPKNTPRCKSMKFASAEDSHVCMQHVAWKVASERQRFFCDYLALRKRNKKPTDMPGVKPMRPLTCAGSEIPSEYSCGRQVKDSVRSRLASGRAKKLDHPIDKRPPLPDAPEFAFLKNHSPALDSSTKERMLKQMMASNPSLSEDQMQHCHKKCGWRPTLYSPRTLQIGAETESPKDVEESLGNSGPLNFGRERMHDSEELLPESAGFVGVRKTKQQKTESRKSGKGKALPRGESRPKSLSFPVRKDVLCQQHIFSMPRCIRLCLRSTAMELAHGATDTMRLATHGVNHHQCPCLNKKTGRKVNTWVAALVVPGDNLSCKGFLGPCMNECCRKSHLSDVVGESRDGVALFRNKTSATRALHLQMIFNCPGDESKRRRRLLFMNQVIRKCGGEESFMEKTKGFMIFPVCDNGSVEEWPMFFYVIKEDKCYLSFEAEEEKMKMVRLH